MRAFASTGAAVAMLAATLGASPVQAASGDTCSEAAEITALPFSRAGSTCGAGNDFSNDAGGTAVCTDLPKGYGGDDVFFKLTLEQGNQVAFDLALPPGATGDLALFLVRAASCTDPLVCAGNSVDLIGAGVGPERIKTNAQAYPSGTYYLIVDSKLSAPDPAGCGAYSLTVTGHLSAFCGNGTVDPGEVCDDGNASGGDCCAADCQSKAAAGTVCRPTNSPCDVAETCGADGTCPVNKVQPAGTLCRTSAGPCNPGEVCDGVTVSCPLDRLFPAGTVCRPAIGVCDQTETCTGTLPGCPADGFKPVGTTCGVASLCQRAPACNASAVCAPGGPVSCEDGNACTIDTCHPVLGCLHAPLCQDAGADASGSDGAADAAPDTGAPDLSLAPDAPGPDLKGGQLIPDAAPPAPDAAERPADASVDAAAPVADARIAEVDGGLAIPDATNSPFEVASLTPLDALGSSPEGGSADALPGQSEAGGKPSSPPDGSSGIAGANGCSCRLGAAGTTGETPLAGLIAVTLLALLALRRRTS